MLNYFVDSSTKNCNKCDNCLTGRGYERKTPHPLRKTKSKNPPSPHLSRGHKEHSPLIKGVGGIRENLAPKAKLSTKLTQLETLDLYNKGMDIKEMAKKRNAQTGTIVQHLCYLIEKGLLVDVDKFVNKAKQNKIEKTIKKIGNKKLTSIKEIVGDDISFDEIKLVLANNVAS